MLDWILKYWVEVAFGLVVSGITIFYKHFLKLRKDEQIKGRNEFKEEIKQQMRQDFQEEFQRNRERDNEIFSALTNLNTRLDTITSGLLSVQRTSFENECKRLLDPEHIITIDEYQQLNSDHDIYHSLGGNHSGDHLFSLVEKKMQTQLQ